MHTAILGTTLAAAGAFLVLQVLAAPVGDVLWPRVIPEVPPGPPSTGTSLSPVTVWRTSYIDFGVAGRSYLVVQSDEEWQALWRAIRTNPVPPPEVDFRTRTAIVALFGEANTGGYSIEINDVVAEPGGRLRVLAETMSPGSGCLTPQVLTYPVHMVSIPKSVGPFVVEETSIAYSCSSA